ncbi:MAG: globin domain-containing protein [Nitrospirota bacterium]|nr:globin domain-containing protein [Nitrospirota bacterium]MDH5773695.1 globin domain-containing protein [Nitrospirota bacterium]
MGLNLKVERLEKIFQIVAPNGEPLPARFYQRLFQKYPAVRPLFAQVHIQQQPKKLLSALVLVLGNVRKSEKLKAALME